MGTPAGGTSAGGVQRVPSRAVGPSGLSRGGAMAGGQAGGGARARAAGGGGGGRAARRGAGGGALVGADFGGTVAPMVAGPGEARGDPGAVGALRALAGVVGTLAVITGRPAAEAVELGGFEGVPGLIVLGHYGLERWEGG